MPEKCIANGVLEGVNAVVINDDREVLMLLRDSERDAYESGWEFVKGGLHVGETHLEAALREIREEAGPITVEFISMLPQVFHVDARYRKQAYDWVRKRVLVFRYKHGAVQIGSEHLDYEWMSPEDASRLCWVEYGQEIIANAMESFCGFQDAKLENGTV